MINTFRTFKALHVPGDPVILYNAWDVGSARAVADAGAKAIATGSLSVAAAQGFDDGEAMPLELALAGAARIAGAVSLPVTIDFEGGYAVDPDDVGENVARLAATGAIGCNFEDQVIGGEGLHPVEIQAARIAGARRAAGEAFFVNARTDIFLQAERETHSERMVEAAIVRAQAYEAAGASGFFAAGLADPALVEMLCAGTDLPVNVIPLPGGPDVGTLAAAGVARISYGPRPYRAMLKQVEEAAQAAFAWR
ncbi:phosphonomutase [Sphingomonas sp. Leaf357]|uniref:isocitrate lyase/PEP mutase family protein n=1 Tax=Sphingomonas sp. Leaf357 TaxID=1736350 RepID=UPI0006F7BC6A|nr:isocitrate lyase/phosphoenolpyruvate mutase family protein [Sphingomonas sp. Leaf357]KQS02094.1 phosphonomutase [Sphingomonas sp. Leaf357]